MSVFFRERTYPKELSKAAEREMLNEVRKRAYKHCDPVVEPFVACVKREGVLKSPWSCKHEKTRMEDCLHTYHEEHIDGAIQEFIQLSQQRRAAFLAQQEETERQQPQNQQQQN